MYLAYGLALNTSAQIDNQLIQQLCPHGVLKVVSALVYNKVVNKSPT